MNKYIFITFSIVNAGGAQLYVRNKAEYLERRGYDVYIFSATDGIIQIAGLKKHAKYIIHDLAYYPQILSTKRIDFILNQIIETLGDGASNIIVESHSFSFGLWGELLAKRISAKHLLYSLEESNNVINNNHFEFILYKWKHRSLVGITPKSLQFFFDKYKVSLSNNQTNWLPAYCNNPVEDIPSNNKLQGADYNICLMGRLNKEYMKPSAYSIAEYVKSYPSAKFNVIIIGGGDKTTIKEFSNIYKDSNNVSLSITGFLSPIPYEFFSQMDVVVTSAGCCAAAYLQGLVVVSIDGHDLKPIGIYKHTTNNSLFRDTEPCGNLHDFLDEILIKRLYVKETRGFVPIDYDFSSHLDIINNMECNNYFPIESIPISKNTKFRANLKRIVYKIIGCRKYENLSHLFSWKRII